ncbi:MAG: glycosyltransferase family 4 protein [Patescibacteria group bacterium]
MNKTLLMVSGDRMLAAGMDGAFFQMLSEFHTHWDRIDIIVPRVSRGHAVRQNPFPNVFVHASSWPLFLQWAHIVRTGLRLGRERAYAGVTIHEYPPFYNGIGGLFLARRLGIPALLEIFHIPGLPRASSLRETIYRLLARIILPIEARFATGVRVMNMGEAGKCLEAWGVPVKKIHLIPALFLPPIPERGHVVPTHDFIFVGRIERNKGIQRAIEALARLEHATMRVIGTGSLLTWAQHYARQQGVSSRITWSGWVASAHEVLEAIQGTRALVMLSDNEGGPRVAVEALACGVPVLATPVGVIPDLERDGAAIRVVHWSPEEIAQGMRDVLEDPSWQIRAEEGSDIICERYARQAVISAQAKIVKDVFSHA